MCKNEQTHRVGTYAQCAKTNEHTGWGHTHNVKKRTNTQGGDIRTNAKTNEHTPFLNLQSIIYRLACIK